MKSSLLTKAESVLETICSLDCPIAIKELAKMLKMPLPTVSRLCADLTEIGLLEKTDYHHLAPGMALLRLGCRAQILSPLVAVLRQPVTDYSMHSGLNTVVFGFSQKTFFQIFCCHQNSPAQDPLRYTGAFQVLMAASGISPEKAQEITGEKYPDMPVTEKVICDQEFNMVLKQKTLTRVDQNRKWMITMPFYYDGVACALSSYGQGRKESSVEAEVFEISKVISRIRTGIDRIGKGED